MQFYKCIIKNLFLYSRTTISPDLLEKARKHDINISSFLDIELRRYIALIESSGPKGIRTPVTGSEGR